MSDGKKRLLIMAAGTGGHIFPGLAIADTMRARGWQVSWLGTAAGMETRIVPQHALEMDVLEFSGLRGKGLKHALGGAIKLVQSFFACRRILQYRAPDVVLGMGGYVTVPGGLMAAACGKPLVLMNADAALLLSNRALKPFADRLLFGLPAQQSGNKVVVSGNSIRSEIAAMPAPEQRYTQRSGALRVLVVGGSLGARVLNETLPKALALIAPEARPRIVHQSGKQNIDALRQAYADAGVEAELVDFIDDMAARYAEADLVICRAGAITISELSAAGVASLLVPLVVSSTSHQAANAQWMAAQGAALHLPQKELSPQELAQRLQALSREECRQMAQRAYALGQRHANETIAGVLEELV